VHLLGNSFFLPVRKYTLLVSRLTFVIMQVQYSYTHRLGLIPVKIPLPGLSSFLGCEGVHPTPGTFHQGLILL